MRRRAISSILQWLRPLHDGVQLLECASPKNWLEERRRLLSLAEGGRPYEEAFTYGPIAHWAPWIARLEDLQREPQLLGDLALLPEDIEELLLETRMCAAVGSDSFAPLAKERFGVCGESDVRAKRWARGSVLSSAAPPQAEPLRLPSVGVGTEPSLLAMLQREVGHRRWPIQVKSRAQMAALAATGPGVVWVAEGRELGQRDAERTLAHELFGHVAPYLKREAAGRWFRRAGQVDWEEGAALWVEWRLGFLDDPRKRQLGMRHWAAMLAHEGAALSEIVALLVRDCDAELEEALLLGMRAKRGGGLGRERVYLHGLFHLLQGDAASEPPPEEAAQKALRPGRDPVAPIISPLPADWRQRSPSGQPLQPGPEFGGF